MINNIDFNHLNLNVHMSKRFYFGTLIIQHARILKVWVLFLFAVIIRLHSHWIYPFFGIHFEIKKFDIKYFNQILFNSNIKLIVKENLIEIFNIKLISFHFSDSTAYS